MSPLKKRTYRTSLERGSICLFCRAGAFQWVFRSLGLHGQYFGRGQAGKDIVVLANLNTSWAIRDWARELVLFFYFFISWYFFSHCIMAMEAAALHSWPRSCFRPSLYHLSLACILESVGMLADENTRLSLKEISRCLWVGWVGEASGLWGAGVTIRVGVAVGQSFAPLTNWRV